MPRTFPPLSNFPTATRILALCIAVLTVACDRPEANRSSHESVTLALNWFPEAEHGGFYAALVHGYYAAQSLEVEIIRGGPDAPVIQRVATGAVDFGVSNADDVLITRAQEAPVVALMAPYQINPRCIMVHEKTGIERIDQIHNMTLALSQRPAFSHFLRKKYSFDGVTLVPYPGNVVQFLLNREFAQQGYVFSEPFVARKMGARPRALLVADTGFNPYASLLITTEESIQNRRQIVAKMVTATVEGWTHYLRDPEATNRHINSVNPEMKMDILEYGAAESRPLVLDQVSLHEGIGTMSLERWQTLLAIDQGRLDHCRWCRKYIARSCLYDRLSSLMQSWRS